MGLRRPPDDLGFEEIGFEEVSDPNKIVTREQAQQRALEVENEGAGFGLEDIAADLLNPIEAPIMAGKATAAAARGIRSMLGLGEKALANPAAKSAMVSAVKSGTSTPLLESSIKEASGKLSSQIADKDAALRALIKGKQGEINPDIVADVFPNYSKKLVERRAGEAGRVPMSSEQLLRLKRASDKAAGYASSDIMNPASKAKVESARRVGDVARQQLYDIAPGSEAALQDMAQSIQQKNYLTKKAMKNPQSALSAKPGTKKFEELKKIDAVAGSNLSKTGEQLRAAKNVTDLPLEVQSLPKLGKRAAYGAAEQAQNAIKAINQSVAPEIAGNVGLRELLQGKLNERPKQPSIDDDLGFEDLEFEEIR